MPCLAAPRAPPRPARRRLAAARAPARRCSSLVAPVAAASSGGGVCGIDLGTTNSCVAVVRDGRAVVVPDADGHRTTPSVVAYLPSGEVLLGRAAQAHARVDPANTFSSVKRLIGRPYADVAEDAARMQFRVAPAADGAAGLMCPALGRLLRPEEVSGVVLRGLLAVAARELGSMPDRAVITVPAYFNDAQRAATEAAGLEAGLARVKLLREPVAAALAYGVGRLGDATVLVVDLGGGTYDVSLLDVGGGTVEVLATSGDARLGGDDFDATLASWLAARAPGMSPKRLQSAARALREALTDKEAVSARLPGLDAPLRVTQQQLETLVAPLLQRLRRPLEQAAWAAGIDLEAARASAAAAEAAADDAAEAPGADADAPVRTKGGGKRGRRAAAKAANMPPPRVPSRQRPGAVFALNRTISEVILVGGATRMPAVQRVVAAMTARPVSLGAVDPDEAVALGAALQAGALDGSVADVETIEAWQAALMRALARKMAADQGESGDEAGGDVAEDEGDEEAAEEDAFEAALLDDSARLAAEPPRRPLADETEDMMSYEASVSEGDAEARSAAAARAARLAARWGAATAADDEEFDGMDIEEIAALGLSEEDVVDEAVTEIEDLRALRAALGEDAFARLTPAPPPPEQRKPRRGRARE